MLIISLSEKEAIMSNVNNINESALPFTVTSAKASQKKGAPSFENVLNSAIDNGQDSKMAGKTAQGLNEILSPAPGVMQPSDIISDKTDNLLSLLESYSSKLENPDFSLRSIEPVLEEIKRNAGNLLEETNRLTEADSALREIATQTAVTAQTEYFKFQRGDYLS